MVSIPFAVTTALLAGTLMISGLTARRIAEPLATPLDSIDPQIAGWTAAGDQTLDAPTLRALDATSYLSRKYRKGDSQLDVFVAFYAQQRAGESMHSPKHCLPGAGWEIWNYQTADIPVDGQTFKVNEYSISHEGMRMQMFYWYQSRSRIVASEYLAKVLLA